MPHDHGEQTGPAISYCDPHSRWLRGAKHHWLLRQCVPNGLTSVDTAPKTTPPSPRRSTAGRVRLLTGQHPPKPSTITHGQANEAISQPAVDRLNRPLSPRLLTLNGSSTA